MRTFIAVGVLLCAAAPVAHADEILGSWCWRMAPINDSMNASMIITKQSPGNLVLEQTFYDGSKRVIELKTAGANRYLYEGSEFGDGVIIRSDGTLQMFDAEGMLDVAKPRSTTSCIKK